MVEASALHAGAGVVEASALHAGAVQGAGVVEAGGGDGGGGGTPLDDEAPDACGGASRASWS